MKKAIKLFAPIIMVAVVIFFAQLIFSGNNLLAQTENYTFEETILNIPEGTNIIGLSTTDNKNFTYTNNSTTYFIADNNPPRDLLFSDFTDSKSTIESYGVTLNNGESFIYMRTLIGTTPTNNILYRVLPSGEIFELKNIYYQNDPSNIEYSFLLETTSICYDYYNNIYLLDVINKVILTYSNSNNRLEIFKELPTFNLSSNSKICCNINGKQIYLLNENNVYKIDSITKDIEAVTIENSINLNNITEIGIDCSGALYFLNITDKKLYKQKTNGDVDLINFSFELSDMFIEQNEGNIYFTSGNKVYKLIADYFIASLTHFPEPITFNSKQYNASYSKFAIAGYGCNLLASPYSISATTTIPQDMQVLILEETISENESFAYCFYETDTTTYLGYINKENFKSYLTIVEETSFHKTFLNTAVYKYPTKNSEKMDVLEKESQIKVLGYYNTNLALQNFYAIEISNGNDTQIAYIDNSYIYSSSFTDIIMLEGDTTPNKNEKMLEYVLIIFALIMVEIIIIAFIVKKFPKDKKK